MSCITVAELFEDAQDARNSGDLAKEDFILRVAHLTEERPDLGFLDLLAKVASERMGEDAK
jgi:hypothetical protein